MRGVVGQGILGRSQFVCLVSVGTSMLIEDVACPVDKLGDMTQDLVDMFQKFGYKDASCFGHALEGNLHLVFSQVWSATHPQHPCLTLMLPPCFQFVPKYVDTLRPDCSYKARLSMLASLYGKHGCPPLQGFRSSEEVQRFSDMMEEMCYIVATKHSGSLKVLPACIDSLHFSFSCGSVCMQPMAISNVAMPTRTSLPL